MNKLANISHFNNPKYLSWFFWEPFDKSYPSSEYGLRMLKRLREPASRVFLPTRWRSAEGRQTSPPRSRAWYRSEAAAAKAHSLPPPPSPPPPPPPINEHEPSASAARPCSRSQKRRRKATEMRAGKMDLKCEESISIRPKCRGFHHSPTYPTFDFEARRMNPPIILKMK